MPSALFTLKWPPNQLPLGTYFDSKYFFLVARHYIFIDVFLLELFSRSACFVLFLFGLSFPDGLLVDDHVGLQRRRKRHR